ncbi:shikimate dehydrogenase [Mesorhizobium sp. NBSH29]|uniref:shikimate dehydrogenase n=1 Tax=Mesorhizobium sp. NBSH29 TaxID=2654249 RepID=UPI0018964568|nr:shikimate dehydrogenase [Mesorhizobium sp. NBSH29]QPC86075.1 shikimate dehydrogenase [Mesorhizobium sp. NBSH29]
MDKLSPIKAFVCGHPIAHSRSPLIHGTWLTELGIAGSYEAIDVSPEDFPNFAAGLQQAGFAGGNVTIPHKEAAFAAAAVRTEAAELIGAVNTLWFDEGRLCGDNTDAYGFAANLDASAPGWATGSCAVVLGAGGAARAVIVALQQRGFNDIRIVNRTVARAQELADHFGIGANAYGWNALSELLTDADLLVNTTALGMKGQETIAFDLSSMRSAAIVTDIVYVPLTTPLLAEAMGCGLRTVDGLGMLLHQAVPGFERWFGKRPDVTGSLRNRIVSDLEQMP